MQYLQVDERLRKQIKEMKEFLTKDQLRLVGKIREVKDDDGIQMLNEFMTFVKSGKDRTSGMMGLPQFLSFLNKSGEEPDASGRNRSPRGPNSIRSTALPRPTSGRPSSARKPSMSSQQTYSISSRSTTPDGPRYLQYMLPFELFYT